MSIGAASSLPFTAALLATLIVGSSAIWGACALWFQVQGGQALKALSVLLWAGFSLTLTIALWQGRTAAGLVTFTAAFGALLIWWQRIAPSNDRIWADDVAQMTTGTVKIRIDDDQAGDAAPAEADLEKRQPIREGDYLGGVESFIENDRKNAG